MMIELLQVTKTFQNGNATAFKALRGIDLLLESHRVTVFKGPSGSGKTTLLSIIGCMARPTSGRIHLHGREITSLPERFLAEIRRTTFGFIFQSSNLIKGITVLENVMIPAYPLGLKYRAIRERAKDLLRQFRIDSKAQQKVEHLSGGERQRTAIARALMNDPAVVIADEPTAHLDTEMSHEVLEIICGLQPRGKTVLIASHDPLVYESPRVDRIVAMRDGAVLSPGAQR